MELNKSGNYIQEIKQILAQARQKAYTAINTAMVNAYWLIGKRIVEEEQNGKERATYGKEVIKNVSLELTKEFGKGFSERSLREFRHFYSLFMDLLIIQDNNKTVYKIWRTPFAISINPIWRTMYAKLHWSHYQRILRISDEKARTFYLKEAASQNWSIGTPDRNISTLYYQRLISSQKEEIVEQKMKENTAEFMNHPDDFIKNPTVLEFLKLSSEKELIAEIEHEKLIIQQRIADGK